MIAADMSHCFFCLAKSDRVSASVVRALKIFFSRIIKLFADMFVADGGAARNLVSLLVHMGD